VGFAGCMYVVRTDYRCSLRAHFVNLDRDVALHERSTSDSHEMHRVSHVELRNDPYTHFSQQLHNKLMWLVIFYYFFTKRKQNKTKK
jgi:hypothetical protein